MRVDDPIKMANILNQYFVNVGSNLDKTIPRTRKSPIDYLKNRNESSMFLAPVTTQEIEVIIQSLNTKKSIGPYSIPVFILKISSKHISKPLSCLVNLSFQTGIFPDYLQVAKVNPIHKKEAFDNPSNYRPISTFFCLKYLKNQCTLTYIDFLTLTRHYTHYSLVFMKIILPHKL